MHLSNWYLSTFQLVVGLYKPSSFVEKGAAILDLKVARPWERVLWPIMQCYETRGWFQWSNDYSSVEDFEMWGNEV